MQRFLDQLERTPAPHRRVRDLFIADNSPERSAFEYFNERRQTCTTLICLVALTLEILTVMLPGCLGSAMKPNPVRKGFPMLKSLTCLDVYHKPLAPELRRLHLLDCSRTSEGWTDGPHLEWLYISGCEQSSSLADIVRRFLNPDHLAHPEEDSPILPLHPSRMAVVAPQPYPWAKFEMCGTGRRKHSMMMNGLKELVAEEKQNHPGTQRFMLLPKRQPPVYSVRQAYQDWLDVCGGGNGCWVMHNRDTVAAKLKKVASTFIKSMQASAAG